MRHSNWFTILTFLLSVVYTAIAVDFPRLSKSCSSDADCMDEFEECVQVEEEMTCMHKSPGPVLFMEWIGYSVIFLLITAANCGGLGGAACVIPLSMIFFGFDIKSAITLSNSSITTSTIVRYVMNFD